MDQHQKYALKILHILTKQKLTNPKIEFKKKLYFFIFHENYFENVKKSDIHLNNLLNLYSEEIKKYKYFISPKTFDFLLKYQDVVMYTLKNYYTVDKMKNRLKLFTQKRFTIPKDVFNNYYFIKYKGQKIDFYNNTIFLSNYNLNLLYSYSQNQTLITSSYVLINNEYHNFMFPKDDISYVIKEYTLKDVKYKMLEYTIYNNITNKTEKYSIKISCQKYTSLTDKNNYISLF